MAEEAENPNLNNNGHTIYPKFVYPNLEKHIPGKARSEGVLVNNAKEEAEVMGEVKPKARNPGWDK